MFLTNQGVETPCYRTSKAIVFSCKHPIPSDCFFETENYCLKNRILGSFSKIRTRNLARIMVNGEFEDFPATANNIL